jgi:hypothetical protein
MYEIAVGQRRQHLEFPSQVSKLARRRSRTSEPFQTKPTINDVDSRCNFYTRISRSGSRP